MQDEFCFDSSSITGGRGNRPQGRVWGKGTRSRARSRSRRRTKTKIRIKIKIRTGTADRLGIVWLLILGWDEELSGGSLGEGKGLLRRAGARAVCAWGGIDLRVVARRCAACPQPDVVANHRTGTDRAGCRFGRSGSLAEETAFGGRLTTFLRTRTLVLMATAAVARPWRKYMRISVRGLIVAVLVLGGGLGWVVNRARVHREAVAAIERAGGSVKYEWDFAGWQFNSGGEPAWLKWLLKNAGPNYVAHIEVADLTRGATDENVRPVAGLKSLETLILRKAKITGPGLAPVAGLAELRKLAIYDSQIGAGGMQHLTRLSRLEELLLFGTRFGDEELIHMKSLPSLNVLALGGTAITDAGLAHLEGLTNLAQLALDRTKITDAGLEHLKGLAHLTFLGLDRTGISGAGLAHLHSLTELGWLELTGTNVGDAELAHLRGHSKLVFLHLDNTKVTDAGLAHLGALDGLQVLKLKNTAVSDAGLEWLRENRALHTLVLTGTNVTDAGVMRLQWALPELKVVR